MNDITFIILKIVVSVCAALFTAYVIPYLKAIRTDKRYQAMIDIITVAVKAAEQQIRESGQGAVKKERVMEFVREWLSKQGIELTYDQLSELIEAAVWNMKQEAK